MSRPEAGRRSPALRGRPALITGAASGIGRATALVFAREGAPVALVDLDAERGEAVVREITAGGGRAIFIRGDVSRADDCERAVREAFLAVDKTQPVFNVKPMEFYLQASLAERTFTLALLGLFGLLALALAAVGIYGVISYSVSLRTREVGIRIALGATRRDVLVMVLGQGLTLIGLGLVAGFAASLALTRFLSSLLYDVRPWDPVTSSAVAAVLAAVALAASYLPARRATRVDPMVALRYE